MMAVDVKGFGSSDDQRQEDIQDGLITVLEQAAKRSHLRRKDWFVDFTGDGELAILPREVPESLLVDDYLRAFKAELTRYNRDRLANAHLRVRIAIHFGSAVRSGNGHYRGQGVVAVSRLVDSDVLRTALAMSGADLAVILSRPVFMDAVLQGYTTGNAEDYRRVEVRQKEFRSDAWILVPGHDIHAMDLDPASADDDTTSAPEDTTGGTPDASGARCGAPRASGGTDERTRGRPYPGVVNNFNDRVDVSGGVIGIKYE